MSNNEKQTDIPENDQPDEAITEATEQQGHADEDIHLLLEDARSKVDQHWNDLLRTQAELENLRKRNARDLENAHKFGMEKYIQEILPVWDSLAMAVAAASDDGVDLDKMREGMDLTLKMMSAAMEKFNVEEVNPVGQPFDPELHQAMSMQETADVAANTVINVFQKGYLLNGRLIRAAMVVVAKAPAGQNAAYQGQADDTGGKIDEQA
jgi:molecular chaperone GrpE